MLVDSHCHLDMLLSTPEENVAGYINAAQKMGVEHFLCVSVKLTDFNTMLKLIEPFDCVSASVGLHPNEVVVKEPTDAELVALASNERVVAIGETGLDYYRSEGDLTWQQNRFRTHIAAAKTIRKPIIVHSRAAKEDTIKILTNESARDVGGVLHCFTEDWEMAQAAMDLGFYISFSGIVTFKNAVTLQEVAQKIPLDRMLIETDAPFSAPVPYRGKVNQPAYVYHVAEFIANLRQEPLSRIAEYTTRNFYNLFKPS